MTLRTKDINELGLDRMTRRDRFAEFTIDTNGLTVTDSILQSGPVNLKITMSAVGSLKLPEPTADREGRSINVRHVAGAFTLTVTSIGTNPFLKPGTGQAGSVDMAANDVIVFTCDGVKWVAFKSATVV